MGKLIAFALLLVCVGASALSAEGRSHNNFAASSYYEHDGSLPNIGEKSAEEKSAAEKTDDPSMRYPKGHYPGQEHVWNPTTEKYETVNDTSADPNMRYPKGHYPGQEHVWNPTTEKYETVNDTSADPNMRYPRGHYPNQEHVWNSTTEQYETVDGTTQDPNGGNPSEGRYEHGYFGEATNSYAEGDTVEVLTSEGQQTDTNNSDKTLGNRYVAGYHNGHSSNPSYTSEKTETAPDLGTFDPQQGRYKHGYYGTNAPTDTASTTTMTFMSMASEQDSTKTYGPEARYIYGYYGGNAPKTTSGNSNGELFKPVTYDSYTGNMQTLPYPNSGVPYVPNGDGCRTAYWAENTVAWPSFLKETTTCGEVFGAKAEQVYGKITIFEALFLFGDDYKDLLRSGCTALLNSYTRGKFPLSSLKVIVALISALDTKEDAKNQALAFETVNVESISGGNACT
ncbi:unnamed protein product [Calypogeia fissa]